MVNGRKYMSAPVIQSIAFDKPGGYNPGELITVTVNYVPGGSQRTETFTGQAEDTSTHEIGTLSVSFVTGQVDPTDVRASDTGNRVWNKLSDNGSVAKFTAQA
jgi:hypothetical protein